MTGIPQLREREVCPDSQRVDGPWHSWLWWGDDPYIICAFCDELRDAHTGEVLRVRERDASTGDGSKSGSVTDQPDAVGFVTSRSTDAEECRVCGGTGEKEEK